MIASTNDWHRLLALAFLMLALAAPSRAQDLPLTYDLTYDFNGQRTFRYAVLQGPKLTLIEERKEGAAPSFTLKEATAVAGPAVGRAPVRIEGAVGETKILVPRFYGSDADFQPGRTEQSESFGEVEIVTYDSLRYDLTRGARDTTIAGREAKHYVLEAALHQHTESAAGEQISAGAERNRHDLWFAADLPFSAAPFAVLKKAGAFMPLGSARADAAIWHGLKDRLRGLGLLVRAEQHRFQKGYSTPTHHFTLAVRNIRPAGDAAPALGSHVLYAGQKEARAQGIVNEMGMGLFMAATQGDAPATFTGSVNGEGYERSLRGPAVFTPSPGERARFKGFTLFLAAGENFSEENPSEGGLLGGVVLFGPKKGLPEPGTYELAGLTRQGANSGEESAGSFTMGAMVGQAGKEGFSERATFTEVSGGTLTIENAGPQRVQGRLEATLTGYVLPGRTEPVEVTLTGAFEAAPGLGR